jgi:Rhodopirellula transposase DDE domain
LDLPKRQREAEAESARVRRIGGGRHRLTVADPDLTAALEALVEPLTRGDPESPLRWTCKSTRRLAEELNRNDHAVSASTVGNLLHEAGYSLQANCKTREGRSHPDRNAQFEFINTSVKRFLKREQPAISVDTKKKELVGDFKNNGDEWHPKGSPEKVRTHDFMDKTLGKVIPYGVYDILNNQGWVNIGIDHDTAKFATNSIFQWWKQMGSKRFPNASELLVTADGGGSNSSRSRYWKICLQELADKLEMRLVVRHFPPGTSKWNKIEHRMFSFITQNWRGKPLVSHQAIVNLIASTTTKTGLVVKAAIDQANYPTKTKVTDAELEAINLTRDKFHGEWNYVITP